MSSSAVRVRREPVLIPTYEPLPPDKNPMFLERRVYQGSSGKVYPLPFYNRISETKRDRLWDAVYVENEFIEVMVLPEIGGRIHVGRDKTNGYDFFYRQNTIKPALVGLAGPWASGGVEFNWPQHHRPATFMPVDVEIEQHDDGSITVWLSDHDPMERMKGMHGVCLHPGRALIELKMRAYNRTPYVQTFLWWANVATHVHEGYQSFFPPDVIGVADHAKRATSRFPLCDSTYYGVNYGERAKHGLPADEVPPAFVPPHCSSAEENRKIPRYAPNDLSWYANIPVPTSYMCIGSEKDFSGGYDYKRQAGLIQVSNHHISPGKKQWTWGNHPFGYAWDRNLTDTDGPYIELMLGVYTDNQPDFSFLQPGETKTWSVFWYPIQRIGPAEHATTRGAISLRKAGRLVEIGVATTELHPGASVEITANGHSIKTWRHDFGPASPFISDLTVDCAKEDLEVTLRDVTGERILSYRPEATPEKPLPAPATEPPPPAEVSSADELFTIGLHLSQYRHATRSPLLYWQEALNRDPGDTRCNNALGLWHLRRGEFSTAEGYFRSAIERLTSRNPNPYDGEPYYNLGLTLRFLGREKDAYAAFYKAAWNQSWQAAAYQELAAIDCKRCDWSLALDHLNRSLRLNTDNLRARNLRVLVLRQLGRTTESSRELVDTLKLDPLDWWARHLSGQELQCDNQTRLDLAWDYAHAGFTEDAIALLQSSRDEPLSGTTPLIGYTLSFLCAQTGDVPLAEKWARAAAGAPSDYCFPARLEEFVVLSWAKEKFPNDARAPYYLGNLLYDKRRYEEAIGCWEKSAALDPTNATVWRNLGIANFNVRHDASRAREAYERALNANPEDARVLHERDQLWKRTKEDPARRLAELERRLSLVAERDDTSIELCALYNQVGRSPDAQRLQASRVFQPWEGGEGLALGQYVRTHLLLARRALRRGESREAIRLLNCAVNTPENLGEAKHLLANQSDVHFWLGEAHAAAGDTNAAHRYWTLAAQTRGDFQDMKVQAYSEMTYFSARALQRLGNVSESEVLFSELLRYSDELRQTPAKIDYFATSLPTLLLFEDDLNYRQETTATFLRAQALLGLNRVDEARQEFEKVVARDPSHAGASDFLGETLSSATT